MCAGLKLPQVRSGQESLLLGWQAPRGAGHQLPSSSTAAEALIEDLSYLVLFRETALSCWMFKI